eukprot:scaffold7181_cov113-Isochrysis_galbana.AAC.5
MGHAPAPRTVGLLPSPGANRHPSRRGVPRHAPASRTASHSHSRLQPPGTTGRCWRARWPRPPAPAPTQSRSVASRSTGASARRTAGRTRAA